MAGQDRITEQLRRNAVALISLVVAVTSLSYNTWRNEKTEYNRNQREAAFELLVKLSALDESVNYLHYVRDSEREVSLKSGWALVNTIEVLSSLLEEPIPTTVGNLSAAWAEYSHQLGGAAEQPVSAIRASVDALQSDTVTLLESLD